MTRDNYNEGEDDDDVAENGIDEHEDSGFTMRVIGIMRWHRGDSHVRRFRIHM